jgi:hypothetical protein
MTMPYQCERLHKGRPITISLTNLSVPQCGHCGELVFDYEAEEQIHRACKTQASELSSAPSEAPTTPKGLNSTALPELLAAESAQTAERLVGLSSKERLAPAEADYILAAGLAAIGCVPKLWPMIRGRIGAGTTGAAAQQLLVRLLDAVDKNLSLAAMLKEPARIVSAEQGHEPEAVAALAVLAAAEKLLRAIRTEAVSLLKVVDAPARWPTDEQLTEAKERMQSGDRLSAEELRQALLDK